MNFTLEIEKQFERGNIYTLNGKDYRIKGFCKYWKQFENGIPVQYDICLYLMPIEHFVEYPTDIDPIKKLSMIKPTDLILHYFNFD